MKFAWSVADTANALMVIPNILALIIMSKTYRKILNDFDKYKDSEKKGNYFWTYDNKWEKYFEKNMQKSFFYLFNFSSKKSGSIP